jgi:hypothetical protein
MPHYPGVASEQRYAIQKDGGIVVEVYQNQYHEQSQGNELISRGSYLFDSMYFTPGSKSIIDLQDSDGQPIQVHSEILTDSSGMSWLTVYTYLIDGELSTSHRHVQLTTALRSIYSRPTAGVIAAATPCMEECESRSEAVAETSITILGDFRARPGE